MQIWFRYAYLRLHWHAKKTKYITLNCRYFFQSRDPRPLPCTDRGWGMLSFSNLPFTLVRLMHITQSFSECRVDRIVTGWLSNRCNAKTGECLIQRASRFLSPSIRFFDTCRETFSSKFYCASSWRSVTSRVRSIDLFSRFGLISVVTKKISVSQLCLYNYLFL